MSRDSHRDWVTDLGLLAVGGAAAVLTFTTLRDLATACGITGEFLWLPLAWLVPVTVDAAGAVAARVWLKRLAGAEAVAFGRVLAWSCIGASVLGNAGEHGMAAYRLAPPWWVVVLVSAVPPAMLGAVVHLAHLVGRAVMDVQPALDIQPSRVDLDGIQVPIPAVQAPPSSPADAGAPPSSPPGVDVDQVSGPVCQDDLQLHRAARLVNAAMADPERKQPYGRESLMKDMDVTEAVAKRLLRQARARGLVQVGA